MQTNLLKAKIVEKDISRSFLASQLGMSTNTLSYKLCGHRPFDVDEVIKLCEILGIADPAEKAQIFLTLPSQKCDAQPRTLTNEKGGKAHGVSQI